MGLDNYLGFGWLWFLFTKRDRTTIIADIIKSVRYNPRGKRKTHIMRNANLNFDQVNMYLDLLMRNGYIMFDGRVYKPTARGLQFLETVENEYPKLRARM